MENKSYIIRYRGERDGVHSVRKALVRMPNNANPEERGWEYVSSIGRLENRAFFLLDVEEWNNGR